VLFWLYLLVVRGAVSYYMELKNSTIIVIPKSNTVEQVGIGGPEWVFSPETYL